MTTKLNQRTDAYDEHHVLDNRLTMEWYPQRVVGMSSGPSMLELGLGHGYTSNYFAKHFSPYRVIDGSAEMIERFRSRFGLPQVDIIESWFETFECIERYDNIAMGFVLEHVKDPGLLLRYYRQFLKPDGSVFVAVPNSESLHRRIGHAAGVLPNLSQLSAVDTEFGHVRYFSLSTLRDLCESSGYEVVRAEGILLKPVTTGQLMQLDLSANILQGLLAVGVDYPELSNSLLLQLKPRADST